MKKFLSFMAVLFVLQSTVFASTYMPSIVKEYKENKEKYLTKTFEINEIYEDNFEDSLEEILKENFKVYELKNVSKTGGTSKETKEESQIKIVETTSDKIEDVLAEFPSEIVFDEEGYMGNLIIDTSSVTTTKVYDGTYTKSYTTTETVIYRNLADNDLENIPKTKVKNGITMNLVSADWKISSTKMVGNYQVPLGYDCVAQYKGTGYQKVTGDSRYTSSALYKGIVEKEETRPVIYEVTYMETANYTWAIITGVIGIVLVVIGTTMFIVKKRRKDRRYY